jgi:putative heme-binding domain-containing protein
MIYRDQWMFPQGEHQHAFTCEPFHNLVQHNVIAVDGVSFRAFRDSAEAELDFFASSDRWCRPVMARTGPDGALWVVDMYRYMIEHPQWLPEAGKEELRPYYRYGDDLGRIYRIVPEGKTPGKIPRLDTHSTEQLVAALESPNGWQRDTAQRLLVANQDDAAHAPLRKMASEGQQPLARLHALSSLDGMGALTADILEAALHDSHPMVRRHAIRLSEHQPVGIANLLELIDDPDPRVRLQLACSLGYFDDPAVGTALATLAIAAADDPYLLAGVTSSLNAANLSDVMATIVSQERLPAETIVNLVFSQAAAIGDDKTIADALEFATSTRNGDDKAGQFSALSLMLRGLMRRGRNLDNHLGESLRANVSRAIAQARVLATDADANESLRVASVSLLLRERDHFQSDIELLRSLLVPRTPNRVQQAIVTHCGRRSESEIGSLLLDGWKAHVPRLRTEILTVVASRPAWVEVLLERLASGDLAAGDIDAPMRQRLLATKDKSTQTRLRNAFAGATSEDRRQVLERYQSVLGLAGNAQRGQAIYGKQCANCHRHAGVGYEVGPNLASITTKTPASLLQSILDPSATVEAKYLNYIAISEDGRSFAGMIASETGSSITLVAAEGRLQSLLRSEIDTLHSSGKSLMPDGLEKDLTAQDISDLIAFVREMTSEN